jgi:predicted MFS family arabinose efflux permease
MTSHLVRSGAIAYGMTCAFVLVRLGESQALLAGVLRIRSDTDHPGPFFDRGRLGCGVGGVQGRRRRSRSDGVVDLRLFRDLTFTGAVATTALASAAYFGMLVYLSLFLQSTQHYGATETGLVYLPTILPFMVVSPLAGRLLARIPGAPQPTIGLALIACGLLLLVGVDEGAGLLDVAAGMAVAGLGTGLAVTPLTQLALDQVPTERSGMASGVLQTSRPLGVTLLGLAVPGQMDAVAFRAVAGTAAGLAVLGAVVAAVTIRAR